MWEIVMRGERPSQKIEIQWKALKTCWIHDDAMPCHYLLMKIMLFFVLSYRIFFNTISEFVFLVHIMLHIILYIQLFKVNEKNQENSTSSCSNDRKTFFSRPLRLKLTSTTPKKNIQIPHYPDEGEKGKTVHFSNSFFDVGRTQEELKERKKKPDFNILFKHKTENLNKTQRALVGCSKTREKQAF